MMAEDLGIFSDLPDETEEERLAREKREREARQAAEAPPLPRPRPETPAPAPEEDLGIFSDLPEEGEEDLGMFANLPDEEAIPTGELDNSALGIGKRYLQSINQGLVAPVSGGMRMLETSVLRPAQQALGMDVPDRPEDTALFQAAEAVEAPYKPDTRDTSIGRKLASGFGSTGGILAAGVLGGPGAAIAAGTLIGGDQAYQDARAHGADEGTAQLASSSGILLGSMDALPLLKMVDQFIPPKAKEAVAKSVMQRVGDVVATGGKEAMQEVIQQIGGNLTAIGLYDKNRDWLEGVPDALLIGGIVGSTYSGAANIAEARRPPKTPTSPEMTPVEEVAPRAPSSEEAEALSTTSGKPSPGAMARPEATGPELVASGAVAPDEAVAALETKGDAAKRISKYRELLIGAGAEPVVSSPPPAAQGTAIPTPAAGGAPGGLPVVPPVAPVPPPASAPQIPPAAAPPTPGAATALNENVPMPAPGTPLPVAAAPVAPAPATPVVTSESNIAPSEQLPTVPEAPQTLELQKEALKAGKRLLVYYPPGTDPEVMGPWPVGSIARMETGDGGFVDYRHKKIGPKLIRRGFQEGTIGKMLGLGPFSKEDVAASIDAGSPAVAVVERTPEGVEVKAAAGTEELAPQQVAALEESKAAPENTVTVEEPEAVIGGRLDAMPEEIPEDTGKPVEEPPTKVVEPVEAPRKPVQRQTSKKLGVHRPPPDRPLAAPPGPGNEASKAEVSPPATPEVESKADLAKRVSLVRSRTKTPEPEVVTSEVTPPKPRKKGETLLAAPVTKARQQEIADAEADVLEDMSRRAAPALMEFLTDKEKQQRADKRAAKDEAETEIEERRWVNPEQEARARLAGSTKMAGWTKDLIVARAKILGAAFNALAPARTEVTSQADANKYADELRAALTQAEQAISNIKPPAAVYKALSPANQQKADRYSSIPSLDRRVGFGTNTNHVVWFAEANRIADLIERGQQGGRALNREDMGQVLSFIGDTVALREGDGRPLRERRALEGEARTAKGGGNANTDLIAAPTAAASLEELAAKEISAGTAEDIVPEDVVTETVDKEGRATLTLDELTGQDTGTGDERIVGDDDVTTSVSSRAKSGPSLFDEQRKAAPGKSAEEDAALKALKERMNAELAAMRAAKARGDTGVKEFADREDLVEEALRLAREKGMDPFDHSLAEMLAEQSGLLGDFADRAAVHLENLKDTGPLADLRRFFGPQMLRRINEMVADVKVHIVTDEHMAALRGASNVAGFYDPYRDAIVIRASSAVDPTQLSELVIHEATHAMTSHAVSEDRNLERRIEGLINYIKDTTDIDPRTYGLKNADEFIAEVFSNPQFQELLSQVTIPKSEWIKLGVTPPQDRSLSNALNAVKYFISRVLGLKPAQGKNALEVGISVGSYVLDIGADARARAYNPANPPNTNVHAGPDQLWNTDLHKEEAEKDPPKALKDRLEESGIPSDLAAELEDLINTEFGGKLSDKALEALAGEYGKPVTSESDLEDKLAATPPGGKDVVTDLIEGKGYDKATKARKFFLKVETLDFIRQKYRDIFVSEGQKILDDIVLATQRREGLTEKYAAKHQENAMLLNKLGKGKDGKQLLHDLGVLAMDATRFDVRLGKGADNSHLGKDAMMGMQAKQELPALQARYDALPKHVQELYQKVTKDYRESHNDTKKLLARNVIEAMGLDVKLTPAFQKGLIDRVVNSTLTSADEKLIGTDAFRALKNASNLKAIKGDYWPQMRFGEHVVVTLDKVDVPPIKDMTIKPSSKSSGKTVPVQVSVVGNFVRMGTDHSEYGAAAQLRRTVQSYVKNSKYQVLSVTRRFRDKKTGELVGKGEQKIGHTYDLTYEIQVQNKGVHYFETNREAQKFYQANKDISKGVFPRLSEQSTDQALGGSLSSHVISRINNNGKLTNEQKKLVKNALQEAVVSSLPGNRSPAKYIARRNVMGFSTDVMRAALTYGQSHGAFMATLETAPEINDTLGKLRNIKEKAASTNGVTGQAQIQVVEELERRLTSIENYKGPNALFKNLSTLSFFGTLASPAHSIINSMQVWVNTYPVLAGHFGMRNSIAAITAAYVRLGVPTQLLHGVTNTTKAMVKWNDLALDTTNMMKSIRSKAGPKYDALFDYMVAHGSLSESSAFEVSSSILEARNVVTSSIARFDRAVKQMPATMEVMNRTATGMGTYDLAIKKGMSETEAIKFAHDIAQSTQFDYRKSNLPPFMKGQALGFAMQFRSYAINQTLLYADMFNRIIAKGATAQERGMAVKQLMNLVAMQAVIAGCVGLPGSELLKIAAMIFGSMIGDDDQWDKWQVWWNQLLRQIVPGQTKWDDVLTNGLVGTALGIDLSNRMTYADLWTGFAPRKFDDQGWKAWIGGLFAGAPGGQLIDALVKAPAKIREGKVDEALENFIPIKIVSDYFKAARGVNSGEMSNLSGIKQVIGFKSEEVAEAEAEEYAPKTKNEETLTKYRKQRNDLFAEYNAAKTAGARARVISKIREWNRTKKPKDVLDINLKTIEKNRREKYGEEAKKKNKSKELVWE